MSTVSPSNAETLLRSWTRTGLIFNAWFVQTVATNCTRISADGPGPNSDSVPLHKFIEYGDKKKGFSACLLDIDLSLLTSWWWSSHRSTKKVSLWHVTWNGELGKFLHHAVAVSIAGLRVHVHVHVHVHYACTCTRTEVFYFRKYSIFVRK